MSSPKSFVVLAHKKCLSSIQKCYLPSNSVDNYKDSKLNIYALLKISSSVRCLCKVYWQTDIHPSVCLVDESVICFSMCRKSTSGFPIEPLNRTLKCLQLEQVELIPSCSPVKNVHLSIIFESVSERKRWQEDSDILKVMVKNILKLYVIVKDSVVFLKHLTTSQRFGIDCIVIHDVSLGNNVTCVGRMVSSTVITITSKLSVLWIQQLQESSNNIPLGGLDNPYDTLQEVIKQQKIFHDAPSRLQVRPCRQVSHFMDILFGINTHLLKMRLFCGCLFMATIFSLTFN